MTYCSANCPVLFAIFISAGIYAQVPPVMARRTIAPSTNEAHGTQLMLNDRGTNFTLFLPAGWTNTIATNALLCIHFHTAPWFPIQEHLRRKAKEPLVVFALGEGSSTYRAPFEDTNRFARVLALVESELQKQSGLSGTRITAVDMSSFSAGYGAVREIVKSPAYFEIIRRIVLLDSMYAALETEEKGSTDRRPLAAQIDVWVPFAKAAMRGEKNFVVTHSQVPTSTYASSAECATALLMKLGVKTEAVTTDSPAASDPNFPLLKRADAGGLHIWSYGGTDAQAHMTHARHMADVWRAFDVVANPPAQR
jgi:hypothetical protein